MFPAQLLIQRFSPEQYAISFVPAVAAVPAWTPTYQITLAPHILEDLAAMLNRIFHLIYV